uniref:CSON014969 protein n=2 Tax=Culicoides sonorensis TaxID=179676 RepID=A0A336MC86_CULSO
MCVFQSMLLGDQLLLLIVIVLYRIAVIIIGICTLIAGVVLASVPWLNYFILKNLRLWNNTLSFHYWQRPGVIRLTKVYIFNVTNPEGFLNGEKPKLVEVGPFVYREDMKKVNIKFHENFTVSYQHEKILEFVPELSVDKTTRITTPNIPLLTLSTQSNSLSYFLAKTISLVLTAAKYKPFISLTVDELVFGYDDALVSLAHRFYPRNKRPMSKMGLLNGRNGTLAEVATIHGGFSGMDKFGYFDKLNGLDHLPYWDKEPCKNISASEGSFFPPRSITGSDVVYVYDKDLCRSLPLIYRKPVVKDGIDTDYYTLAEDAYGGTKPENQCYNEDGNQSVHGLQNISPCQYGAPVYISNPHFYQADSSLLEEVEGLNPDQKEHETYFKIQPKLGVPLEGKVRVQLNLKVENAPQIESVKNFRSFVFPIMWLEEGVSELTPPIRRWIYLGTVFAPIGLPTLSYSLIVGGILMIVFVFVRTYQNFVFSTDPTTELLEMGRRSLRRSSNIIINGSHNLMVQRDSYHLLKNLPPTPVVGEEDC